MTTADPLTRVLIVNDDADRNVQQGEVVTNFRGERFLCAPRPSSRMGKLHNSRLGREDASRAVSVLLAGGCVTSVSPDAAPVLRLGCTPCRAVSINDTRATAPQ